MGKDRSRPIKRTIGQIGNMPLSNKSEEDREDPSLSKRTKKALRKANQQERRAKAQEQKETNPDKKRIKPSIPREAYKRFGKDIAKSLVNDGVIEKAKLSSTALEVLQGGGEAFLKTIFEQA